MFFLFILFIVIPIIELYIIVQVAQTTGVFNSIALLILVSLIGAWLVKAEGTGVLKKIRQQLMNAEMPNKEIVDGGLILLAGALMLTPGFLTDAFGLLLLFPVTRPIFRTLIIRKVKTSPLSYGSSKNNKSGKGHRNNSFIYFRNRNSEITDIPDNQSFGNTPIVAVSYTHLTLPTILLV